MNVYPCIARHFRIGLLLPVDHTLLRAVLPASMPQSQGEHGQCLMQPTRLPPARVGGSGTTRKWSFYCTVESATSSIQPINLWLCRRKSSKQQCQRAEKYLHSLTRANARQTRQQRQPFAHSGCAAAAQNPSSKQLLLDKQRLASSRSIDR